MLSSQKCNVCPEVLSDIHDPPSEENGSPYDFVDIDNDNNNNSPFLYSALSLQQFPCTSAIIIAVIRKSSELLSFINRPTCTTYRTLNCDIPHNSYPHIAWVDEASEIDIMPKDTNTLVLTGLELTTFRLWL